jgi:hypothetical protein
MEEALSRDHLTKPIYGQTRGVTWGTHPETNPSSWPKKLESLVFLVKRAPCSKAEDLVSLALKRRLQTGVVPSP